MSDIIPERMSDLQQDLIVLSLADQVRFDEMLLNPPPLAPAMERAIESHRKLFQTEE